MTKFIRKSRDTMVPLLAFVAILSGCATTPSGQQIGTTDSTVKVSSVRQQPEHYQNAEVIWGGSVIGIDNRAEETWIEIIDRPLRRSGIPDLREKSNGRFFAIVPGFLDPLDYSDGQSITISGTVTGSETRKISEADYNYPKVAVVDHQLWPKAQVSSTRRRYSSRRYYPYDYYRYPYRRHYGIGYGRHGHGHSGHYNGLHSYGYGYSRYRGRHRKSAFISGRSRY